MQRNRQSSLDGFIPRRADRRLGDLHDPRKRIKIAATGAARREINTSINHDNRKVIGNKSQNTIHTVRPDIDETLKSLDFFGEKPKKLTRKERRRLNKLNKKPKSRIRRIIKYFFILLFVATLGIGAYTGYKFIVAGGNIVKGNIWGILQEQKLKEDSNGYSNFLILGTSEDDPGHGGANLTDSILVLSVNQATKDAYMFSVPRDLYVKFGMACNSGYSGKINEYFNCVNSGDTTDDEQERLTQTQAFIGEIFGIDIQYGIHVNHTVIKQAVDAVGGVDVDIQGSNGAPGILDRNFDWRCKYTCYYVKYTNGIHHLDGIHALFLAQARGDVSPTYGLGNSNFDREKNQQKILIALKDKAMSAGTLADINAITKLIDALGDNLRTNIESTEIRTLMKIANSTKTEDIHRLSLIDEDLLATGNVNGASVVIPTEGTYAYADIQNYIAKNLSSDPILSEAAPIAVYNGTGQVGFALTNANELEDLGYTIAMVDNAPSGEYDAVEIYQIGDGNTGTSKKLASRYGVTVKATTPPVTVSEEVKFVIIFGSTDFQVNE